MSTAGSISLIIIGTAITGVLLVLATLVTTPTALGATGVTLWFLDLLVALGGAMTLVLYVSKSYLHLHATSAQRLRYSWRQGLLVGGWVTFILALSSLGQLAPKDAVLIGVLLLLFEVYMRLRRP
jgi:hypothetical protein